MQQLQNQLFSIIGDSLFALGLWLVRKHLLHVSWRKMLLITTLMLNLIDMPFAFCTIFDVIRNQYFYCGETVLVEVPMAAHFVVGTFVVIEMVEEGHEGLVYAMLTTARSRPTPLLILRPCVAVLVIALTAVCRCTISACRSLAPWATNCTRHSSPR